MADFPTQVVMPTHISVYSQFSAAASYPALVGGGAAGSSQPWPTANRGLYLPIFLPAPFLVASFFCLNGTTATGNIDMGLYTYDGALIVSKGSTAQSGTSAVQILSVTATLVAPGRYYMAISASSSSATFIARTPVVTLQQRLGILEAATQLPLATAPTFATPTMARLPYFGMASLTTY